MLQLLQNTPGTGGEISVEDSERKARSIVREFL